MASAYLALPLSRESATPRLYHYTGFPVLVLVLSLVPLVLFVSVFIVLVLSLVAFVSVFFVLVHHSRALFSLT